MVIEVILILVLFLSVINLACVHYVHKANEDLEFLIELMYEELEDIRHNEEG